MRKSVFALDRIVANKTDNNYCSRQTAAASAGKKVCIEDNSKLPLKLLEESKEPKTIQLYVNKNMKFHSSLISYESSLHIYK